MLSSSELYSTALFFNVLKHLWNHWVFPRFVFNLKIVILYLKKKCVLYNMRGYQVPFGNACMFYGQFS